MDGYCTCYSDEGKVLRSGRWEKGEYIGKAIG